MPLVFFCTLSKYQKTRGFLFSGGIESKQWHEIGSNIQILKMKLINIEGKKIYFLNIIARHYRYSVLLVGNSISQKIQK